MLNKICKQLMGKWSNITGETMNDVVLERDLRMTQPNEMHFHFYYFTPDTSAIQSLSENRRGCLKMVLQD